MQIQNRTKQGVVFALAAYIIWGIVPIYFKSLHEVPAFEVLCHRIIWSFFLLTALLFYTHGWKLVQETLSKKINIIFLMTTSLLIASNWLIYIWAVNANHMLDASLGYYINPILSVLLGLFFLKERLRPIQWFAVALASTGVLVQLIVFGSIPIIALGLAATFGFYGLLRKKINIDALTGLFIETLFLFPIAMIYLIFISDSKTSNLTNNTISLNLLIAFSGIITTVPLLCFTAAAVRLRLSTLGFIQYIGPSIMFMLAIFMYHEPFTYDKAITFTFIWLALIIFTWESIKARPKKTKSVQVSK